MKPLELEEATKLKQVLALHDTVAISCGDPREFLQRSCQAIALLLQRPGAAILEPAGQAARLAAFYGISNQRAAIEAWLGAERPSLTHLANPISVTVEVAGGGPAQLLLLPFHPPRVVALVELEKKRFSADELWSAQCLTAILGARFGYLERQHQLAASGQEALEAIVAMAHDLRSPLNVIFGYASLLAEEAYGPLNPQQKEILASLTAKAEVLLSLLAGALDLARLEVHGNARAPTEVSLEQLLGELVSAAASRANDREVAVEYSVGPSIPVLKIEKAYLEHILQNLVDNALDATTRGTIRVQATYENATGLVRITVSDTGKGIDPERIPQLFQLFQGASEEEPSRRTHGCGLFLVRKFCERLGAKVEVTSEPGAGSSFSVLLPVSRPESRSA